MVAPLIAAGARLAGRSVGKAARRTAAQGSKATAGRRQSASVARGILNARTVQKNLQATDGANRTTRTNETIDEIRRRESEAVANNSVTKSAEIRLQKKAAEENAQAQLQTAPSITKNSNAQQRVNKLFKSNKAASATQKKASRKAKLFLARYALIGIVIAYVVFFLFWLLQTIGLFLVNAAIGYANSGSLVSDIFSSQWIVASVGSGLVFFTLGYLVSTLLLICINLFIIAYKKLSRAQSVLWLSLTLLPFVQIVTLGIWLSRGQTSK